MALIEDSRPRKSIGQESEEIPIGEAVAGIPSVYGDGARYAEIHGDNVHIIYCEIQGPPGAEVAVPVLRMIRPLRTCAKGDVRRLVDEARERRARIRPRH